MKTWGRLLTATVAGMFGLLLAATSSLATTGTTDWLISTDFASIQAAIDSLPAPRGGVVYVPGGRYTQTAGIVLPSNKPVRLVGAGFGATVLEWTTGNVDYITIRGNDHVIEGLTIQGNNSIFGSACGVVVDSVTSGVRNFQLRNVDVVNIPEWSLEDRGTGSKVSRFCKLDRCHFSTNVGNSPGLVKISAAEGWAITNCSFGANWGTMLELSRCTSTRIEASVFDAPNEDEVFVTTYNCNAVTFNECYFERPGSHSEYFVRITGSVSNNMFTMANCYFTRGSTAGKLVQCGSTDVVKNLVMINPSVLLSTTSTLTGPELDIGNAASVVSVVGGMVGSNDFHDPRINDATNRSFLGNYNHRVRLPRLTTNEREVLTDVKVGDMIYNTDTSSLEVWLGSSWGKVTTTESP